MRVETTPIANDTANGFMAITDSTVFAAVMKVMLEDTTTIDEILVQLGDQGNPTSKMQYTFEWDVNPGGNYSFSRSEFQVNLGLGEYVDLINYEATLRIKRTNGSYSDVIHFSR